MQPYMIAKTSVARACNWPCQPEWQSLNKSEAGARVLRKAYFRDTLIKAPETQSGNPIQSPGLTLSKHAPSRANLNCKCADGDHHKPRQAQQPKHDERCRPSIDQVATHAPRCATHQRRRLTEADIGQERPHTHT